MRQKTVITNVLQSVTDCYYKVHHKFITKCDRLLLQSASGVTKCDSCYKVRRNTTNIFLSNSYRTQGPALSAFTLPQLATRGIL